MPAEPVPPNRRRGVPRRSFLAWCALLPGFGALAGGKDADDAVQLLRQRSASLTGFPASALDQDFAAALWAAFSAAGRSSDLRAWLAGREPRSALDSEITAAWYGGMLPGTDAVSVDAYYGALAWQAAAFATPAGRCGAPGHWARPPRSAAPTSRGRSG